MAEIGQEIVFQSKHEKFHKMSATSIGVGWDLALNGGVRSIAHIKCHHRRFFSQAQPASHIITKKDTLNFVQYLVFHIPQPKLRGGVSKADNPVSIHDSASPCITHFSRFERW